MANTLIDMVGFNVGKLTVIGKGSKMSSKHGWYWLCECECGVRKEVSGVNLRQHKYLSCGCEARRLSSERRKAAAMPPKACSIEDCDNTVQPKGAKGMCGLHYMRFKRYGDPLFVTSVEDWREKCREAQIRAREGFAAPNTYRKYYGKHAHRRTAEDKIGRALLPGECVHHIDGDKHNNHPDNLEVLSRADHLRVHLPDMLKRRKDLHGY